MMENKTILKNYQIPFIERTTSIGNKFPRETTLFNVNGIGVYVEHEKDNLPTQEEVSRHLIGISTPHRMDIQAESLEAALKEFFSYPACNTGFKKKALEIADSEGYPVIEYSGCKWLLNDGFRKCQRFSELNEIDNMFCILDGLDEPPCDCPILKQKQLDGFRSETINIGTVWVKKFQPNVIPMSPIRGGIRPAKC